MDIKAFNGLVDPAHSERRTPGDLVRADHVTIDDTGALARRAGRTQVAAGAFHSLWAEGDLCLMVGGAELLRVHPDYHVEPLRAGLTAGAPMRYCEVAGRVYFSNGHDSGVIEHGRARAWGIAPPAHPPAAALTVGALSAGTYQYALTYLADDGQESGAGLAGRIEAPNDGAGIVLSGIEPPADPRVAAIMVYLTEPNGAVLYEALALPPGTTTATLTRASPNAVPLATQHLGPPLPAHALAYYNGRLYTARDNTLYPSLPHAYELFDLREYLALDGQINMIAAVEHPTDGGLIVATDAATLWMAGRGPEDFTVSELADYGAIVGTLTYVDGTLFGDGTAGVRRLPMWVSTNGICVAKPGGELANLTLDRLPFDDDEDAEGAALFMDDTGHYIAITNH